MIYDWSDEQKPKHGTRVYVAGILAPRHTFYADTEKGIIRYYLPHPESGQPFFRHDKDCLRSVSTYNASCLRGCGIAFEEVKLQDPRLLTVVEP